MVWAACISFQLSFFNQAVLNAAQSSLQTFALLCSKLMCCNTLHCYLQTDIHKHSKNQSSTSKF